MTVTDRPDCLIIGAGFTGLAAAADLVSRGRSVVVVEKERYVGGLASGFQVGGQDLEKFYHHWFLSDHYVTDLAVEIGCSDHIITRQTRTGMYFAGSFFRLSTPLDLLNFRPLSFVDRIRTGLATLAIRNIKDWGRLEGLSAKEWLITLYGERAFRVVWEPLLVGKFGRFADEVSAVWFWNKLVLRGASRNKRGAEALAYYRGGFAAFARHIADFIVRQRGHIKTGVAALSVGRSSDSGIEVATTAGVVTPRSILVTTPLPQAADLFIETASPAYSEQLRRISYLANVCLVLELDRSLSELYWINVNDPSFPFVGIIEHTNFEPSETYGNRHIVYLSKYLPADDPLYAMNADELYDFTAPHLKKMFPTFDHSWVKGRHVWRAEYAQPIVQRYYSKIIPPFETPVPNAFLCTMAQVYPEDRGTNYAIRNGKAAAARIHQVLNKGPNF
jgi:protoporphyrinogen oxidase